MLMARRSIYFALGILALSLAYHPGASRSVAQGGGRFVGIAIGNEGLITSTVAITRAGDVYARGGIPRYGSGQMIWSSNNCQDREFMGNGYNPPVNVQSDSFGAKLFATGRFGESSDLIRRLNDMVGRPDTAFPGYEFIRDDLPVGGVDEARSRLFPEYPVES
jgi:hypothetical protein